MNLSHSNTRRLSITLTAGALVALGLLLYRPVLGGLLTRSHHRGDRRIQARHGDPATRGPRPHAKNDRGAVPDSFPLDHMLLATEALPRAGIRTGPRTSRPSPTSHRRTSATGSPPSKSARSTDRRSRISNTIKSWLESHGFTVYGIHPNRMVMDYLRHGRFAARSLPHRGRLPGGQWPDALRQHDQSQDPRRPVPRCDGHRTDPRLQAAR